MGPTLFLPRTHTAAAHADFYTYANFDLAFSSVDDEVLCEYLSCVLLSISAASY
jgi:hypothetical protein